MMRSLFSGVSGLRVHQSRMDVIGNNIANVNTVGFKASRMTFADAISQRLAGASADNVATGRAGRNPQQIGLGVNIGGIDNIMTQGAAQRTDRPLDITIQGEGFFIVSDASGVYFTRAGNVDWNGRTFSIGGMRLMGWPAVEDRANPGQFIIQPGNVEPLETPPHVHFMDPRPTCLVEVTGNMNVHEAIQCDEIPGTFFKRRPVQFYDTVGTRYTANVTFRWWPPANHQIFEDLDIDPDDMAYQSDNTMSVWTFEFDRADGVPPGFATVTPVGTNTPVHVEVGVGGDSLEESAFSGHLIFNPWGGLVSVGPNGPPATLPAADERQRGVAIHLVTHEDGVLLPPAFPGAPSGPSEVEGNPSTIIFDFGALLQQNGMNTSMRMSFRTGNPPGSLQDIMIGPDGIISGRYSNGHTRVLGQIPLAKFLNPAGLERVGNNLWIPTMNSGWFDGVGDHGDMMPGTLEMSNVDLSSEFTEMITTQRGFQANSRIITTSDEMLMELVNLRR